jgi:hypothetical protein
MKDSREWARAVAEQGLRDFLDQFTDDEQEHVIQYALDHVVPKLKAKRALATPEEAAQPAFETCPCGTVGRWTSVDADIFKTLKDAQQRITELEAAQLDAERESQARVEADLVNALHEAEQRIKALEAAAQPVQAVAWDAEAFRWALKKIRAQGVCNDEQAMLERFSAMSSQKGA